jgi:hypothetical protein
MSRTDHHLHRLLAERVRLGTSARRGLYLTLAAVIASGLWWLGARYAAVWSPTIVDDIERLAQESLALKVHGAAAFVTVFALGAMSVHHVRRAWVLRRNRWLGSALLVIFSLLVATGYALYYLVTDETREVISIAHWVIGLTVAPIVVWHIVMGRRSRADTLTKDAPPVIKAPDESPR